MTSGSLWNLVYYKSSLAAEKVRIVHQMQWNLTKNCIWNKGYPKQNYNQHAEDAHTSQKDLCSWMEYQDGQQHTLWQWLNTEHCNFIAKCLQGKQYFSIFIKASASHWRFPLALVTGETSCSGRSWSFISAWVRVHLPETQASGLLFPKGWTAQCHFPYAMFFTNTFWNLMFNKGFFLESNI